MIETLNGVMVNGVALNGVKTGEMTMPTDRPIDGADRQHHLANARHLRDSHILAASANSDRMTADEMIPLVAVPGESAIAAGMST